MSRLPPPTIPSGIDPLTLTVNAHDGTFILPMNNTSEWIVDWGDGGTVNRNSWNDGVGKISWDNIRRQFGERGFSHFVILKIERNEKNKDKPNYAI